VQNKIDRQCSDERAALARAVPFADRSIMIRGLPMGVFDLVECEAIEKALKKVFSEWVMEGTSVVPGQGYGFIRVSERFIYSAVALLAQCRCVPQLVRAKLHTPRAESSVHFYSLPCVLNAQFSTAEVVSRAIEELNGGMIRLIEQREGGSVLRLSPMVL
jgi:hypothetical protein